MNNSTMIRISQLKLNIKHGDADLITSIAKNLRIKESEIQWFKLIKKSIDARDKQNILYVYTIDVKCSNEQNILKNKKLKNISLSQDKEYKLPQRGIYKLTFRPIIVGSGPAGLFAAYFLAKYGYRPIILERGEKVEERSNSVKKFWEQGFLNENSNVQFGEGGAGTFSDGKLNTGVNDPNGRNQLVLKTFIENGANENILFMNKPHLGTDALVNIVSTMRKSIIHNGGEFFFNTIFESFSHQNGRIKNINVYDIKNNRHFKLETDVLILAIGHSARDTFEYIINQSPLEVEAKAFAVGVRAEHLQSDIGYSQYGRHYVDLPAADYKLTYHAKSGNSVYSFCMCPGGYVVNSSSEKNRLCINGMSYSGRNSKNANSAIVVGYKPSDDPLENIEFQRDIESRAFHAANGKIVSQRFEDFENCTPSSHFGKILPEHKGLTGFGDINLILPEAVCRDIKEAMHDFSRRIKGFDSPDVIISAVESRTSSPVRILRDENMETIIKGIYPIGEGAGYAGGITSAAIDGIKAFEKIYNTFEP